MNHLKNPLNKAITGLAAFAMVLTLTYCDSPMEDSGTFRVFMHDEEGNYDAVNVEVQRIEVNNQEDEEEGWHTIAEPDQVYDLLEYTNGNMTVLGEAELEAGTYRQIRMILGENNSVTVDGETYDMMVPSGAQTGLKLNIDAEIETGMDYELILDFDADRSVVKQGEAPGESSYLLKPVIRAVSQAVSGNIEGEVDPHDSIERVYALDGDEEVTSAVPEEDSGYFMLMSLEEGTYDVQFVPEDGYEELVIEDVEVTAGESTDLETVEISEEDSDE